MFRKTTSLVLIFLLPLLGLTPPRCSYAQEADEYTIAVLDLAARGISQAEAEYLSDYMRGQVTQLVSSADYIETTGTQYTVVERSQMDKILEQFELQNLGCTDVSCAVEFGKLLSVERIVIGSVGLVGQTYSIATRIVDVETASTVASADYTYTGPIDELLTTGVAEVANQLMYGQQEIKSRRNLYIIAGVAIAAGAAAYFLIPGQEDEPGTITVRIPVP
ncbi:CsgG/HfaB family protein [Candidatus Latescibacterota bacterium]